METNYFSSKFKNSQTASGGYTPLEMESTSYKEFDENLSDKGWVGRKILAIPLCIGYATLMPIYHLGCALFKAFSCQRISAKNYVFSIGRDFEKALGWVIVLFKDKLGHYWIQYADYCHQSYQKRISGINLKKSNGSTDDFIVISNKETKEEKLKREEKEKEQIRIQKENYQKNNLWLENKRKEEEKKQFNEISKQTPICKYKDVSTRKLVPIKKPYGIARRVGTGLGEGVDGVYELDEEKLRRENPESDLLSINKTLLVKKGENLEVEFSIGNRLDNPHLVKSHKLFIKNESSNRKDKIVLEKVEGNLLIDHSGNPNFKLENDVVIKALKSAKETCLYLFEEKVCWVDINSKNMIIDQSNTLRIFDFGLWREEGDLKELAFSLLTGSMEIAGWILWASKIAPNDNFVTEQGLDSEITKKMSPFVFPESFFEEKIERGRVTSINADKYSRCDGKLSTGLSICWKKIESLNETELKNYISSYFNNVIEGFENAIKN